MDNLNQTNIHAYKENKVRLAFFFIEITYWRPMDSLLGETLAQTELIKTQLITIGIAW